MKHMIIAAVVILATTSPANAFSLRKVLGAPFFAVGFTAALIADVTVVPIYNGAKHYIYEPAISGW